MTEIKFSFCSNKFDEGAIESEHSAKNLHKIHDFLKKICESTPVTTNKEKLDRFMPCTYNQVNSRRTMEDFIQTSLMVLDIDTDTEQHFEEFILAQAEQGTGFFYYETPSSTPEHKKYRAVFELEKPINTIAEFKLTYRKLFDTKIVYDESCNDVARFFYIPNISKIETFVMFEGAPIKNPEISKEEIKNTENIKDVEEVDEFNGFFLESPEVVDRKLKYILHWLQQNNMSITKTYREWLNVCFACVSLKNHNLAKESCFSFFYSFSKLDKEKCADKETALKQFETCYESTHDKITIATIYGAAKKAGCPPPPVNPEIIKLVKAEEKNCYYLALNNTESDDIVPLNKAVDAASVAREKVLIDDAQKFAIKKNEIQYLDEKTEKYKFSQSIAGFIAKYERQPDKIYYLLGNNKQGRFYEKSTNSLLISDHYRIPCKAVFHTAIDLWLKQLNRPIDWLYTYLFYVARMDVALPMLHLWGISRAGKSILALLVGSIWSNPPVDNYFMEGSSFKDTAGSSPIILFDEFIPNRPNEIKAMITSNRTSVNQKFKTAIYLRGYPRLISTANEEKFKFPGGTGNSDQGAIYSRVQDIEYTVDNFNYLRSIGGVSIVMGWMNGAFREHVKYVQENPEKFNIKQPSSDIIILAPEHKDTHNYTFNSKQQAIIEYFYGTECKITKDNEGDKEIHINVKNFFEALIKNRYIMERGSDEDMVSMLRRPFERDFKMFRRDKDKMGNGRWRLNRDKVIEIQKKMNLHMEELENL